MGKAQEKLDSKFLKNKLNILERLFLGIGLWQTDKFLDTATFRFGKYLTFDLKVKLWYEDKNPSVHAKWLKQILLSIFS